MTPPTRHTGDRYTGGDTMPPFPVMHGLMYYEPQTIGECTNTSCYECAYRLLKIDPQFVATVGIKGNCQHREIMIQVELVR